MIRTLFIAGLMLLGSVTFSTAQDMPLTQVLIDGEGWELVADGFKFTEGPAADAHGNVFFTDIPNSRIHKIDAAGKLTLFAENTGKANGLMFGPDGRLYACQNGDQKIVAYDSSGQRTTIAEGLKSNDLVVRRDGSLYVTDPENKQVWYISPKGEKRIVDTGLNFPNGIILWPDQGTLVVAEMRSPHLWAFRIEDDGSLAHKERYYTMQLPAGDSTESGADGMTVDSAGRLYVTTKVGLQMFDPTGRLGGNILKPQKAWLANVVFGGPQLDTLYVTCTDKVFKRKTKVTGVLYFQKAAAK